MKNILYLCSSILLLGCIGLFEEPNTIPQDKLSVIFTRAKIFVIKKYENREHYEPYIYKEGTGSFAFHYGLWGNTEISIEPMPMGVLVGYKSQIFNKEIFYTSIKSSIGGGGFFDDEIHFLAKAALLQGFSLPENDIYWGLSGIYLGTNHIIVSASIGYTLHNRKNLNVFRLLSLEGGYLYNYERYKSEIRDAACIYVGAGLAFNIHL